MSNLLAQLIVAARDNDMERWTNILFVIVVGIFWVVGGILKARANKAAEKGEKKGPRRPAVKGPEVAREKQAVRQRIRPFVVTEAKPRQPQIQPKQRKMMRPRQAGGKLAAEIEQAIEIPTLEPMEVSKVAPAMPEVAPELGEMPEFTAEAVEQLGDKKAAAAEEMPRYLDDVLRDYDDPETLRRAILHYEILGKPISMRRPGEHITGV